MIVHCFLELVVTSHKLIFFRDPFPHFMYCHLLNSVVSHFAKKQADFSVSLRQPNHLSYHFFPLKSRNTLIVQSNTFPFFPLKMMIVPVRYSLSPVHDLFNSIKKKLISYLRNQPSNGRYWISVATTIYLVFFILIILLFFVIFFLSAFKFWLFNLFWIPPL